MLKIEVAGTLKYHGLGSIIKALFCTVIQAQSMQLILSDLSLSAAGSETLNFQDRLDLKTIMPLFWNTMFCYV